MSNERWSELIGKNLKSNRGSDSRRIGESGFRRLPYARGQAASETSLVYQQLAGSVENRGSRGVVIEAKHFQKALRRAYKSTAILSTTCRTYRGLCQNLSSQ